MRRIVAIAACSLLAGCGPDLNMPMRVRQHDQDFGAKPAEVRDNELVEVTRIGVFTDTLAYEHRRGVYLIRDKETGREYLGVSGIGISERGDHPAGKSRLSDER